MVINILIVQSLFVYSLGVTSIVTLHDKLDDDWHIYELKLPYKKGTIRTREIVSFSSEVNKAISQVLLYKELLSQSDIRKRLADKYGLNLRCPNIICLLGCRMKMSGKRLLVLRKG